MSLDYHTYFPSVDLTRVELFERLHAILLTSGMSFSGQCMELKWSRQEDRHVFTYDERRFDDARNAILQTAEWEGVMLEYDCPFGDRSVFFWKGEKDGGEVFGFDDTSGHFVRLKEDEESWMDFEEFVMDVASAMGASYALVMADPSYVTLAESDVTHILDQLPDSPLRARPPLVVLRAQLRISDRARAVLDKYYCTRDADEYTVYRENEYGMGPS